VFAHFSEDNTKLYQLYRKRLSFFENLQRKSRSSREHSRSERRKSRSNRKNGRHSLTIYVFLHAKVTTIPNLSTISLVHFRGQYKVSKTQSYKERVGAIEGAVRSEKGKSRSNGERGSNSLTAYVHVLHVK